MQVALAVGYIDVPPKDGVGVRVPRKQIVVVVTASWQVRIWGMGCLWCMGCLGRIDCAEQVCLWGVWGIMTHGTHEMHGAYNCVTRRLKCARLGQNTWNETLQV